MRHTHTHCHLAAPALSPAMIEARSRHGNPRPLPSHLTRGVFTTDGFSMSPLKFSFTAVAAPAPAAAAAAVAVSGAAAAAAEWACSAAAPLPLLLPEPFRPVVEVVSEALRSGCSRRGAGTDTRRGSAGRARLAAAPRAGRADLRGKQ